MRKVLTAALLLGRASAQQVGKNNKEEHIPVTVGACDASGCKGEAMEATLDANWRWTHGVSGYQNCYEGSSWDATLCPDAETCTTNCALEGVDKKTFSSTYGVTPVEGGLELKFKTGNNVGSRMYLMDTESTYKLFKLKNKEFSFEVDVSTLECGLNGAFYLVEMAADGGLSSTNKAGAKYGTGYCDGQCPHDVKFINGEANIKEWDSQSARGHYGSCCAEMDLWEANAMAAAYTAHPCALDGPLRCEGKNCGDGNGWASGQRYNGVCDADGCDFNSYRAGNISFYGKGAEFTIDTSRPFKVVTQFITADGTDEGDLSEIRRVYVQDGKEIQNAASSVAGLTADSLTKSACAAQKYSFGDKDDFTKKGGLKQMGEALGRGMVLVLSLWDDASSSMLWLDSDSPPDKPHAQPGIARGPCPTTSGKPSDVRSKYPDAAVKYSNIMYGDIGSTIHAEPISPAPRPSPAPSPPGPAPAGGKNCCWGSSSCDSSTASCQAGWCGENENQCKTCGGMWCGGLEQNYYVV